jgi:hypothetical protein
MSRLTRGTVFTSAAILLLLIGGLSMFFAREDLFVRTTGFTALMAGIYCSAQARNARRAAAGILASPRRPSPIGTWHIFVFFALFGASGLCFLSLFLFGNTQFGVFILYGFVGLCLAFMLFTAWLVGIWTLSWFQR